MCSMMFVHYLFDIRVGWVVGGYHDWSVNGCLSLTTNNLSWVNLAAFNIFFLKY